MNLRANTAVLFSEHSRNLYVQQAQHAGETYSFASAYGMQRDWLKGEYAYLAVNAVSTVLHRFAFKHDIVTEFEFVDHAEDYTTLFIPNAGALSQGSIDAIRTWLDQSETFLVVSGKTNLPKELLGLASYQEVVPDGYTGWRWGAASPFADHASWGEYHVSSYHGYTCNAATASEQATVLADLYEFSGELTSADSSTKRRLGDGIIATGRSIYIANQIFEFLGGVIQAHLNVEDVRLWNNPTHWGDTLAYFVQGILRSCGPDDLWQARLQPFGTYDGVLQLRHDTDHENSDNLDLSMLEYQVENAVPASYYVMDPQYCTTRCTELGTRIWIEEATKYEFIELAQHNDSVDGDPPWWIVGTGLEQHIRESDLNLGIKSRTAGRHLGFLVYPETIDAMDYLYEHDPDMLGLCTFSLYDMLAYGERNPDVTLLGKQLTYVTYNHDHPSIPAAIPGYWFPYNAVVSTVDEHKQLRGWDVTHDTDCDVDRIEELFHGRNSHDTSADTRLENGVFTIQYETQLSRNPHANQGRGHFPWMRYAIAYAERQNFWLTTKQALYERMNDYRDIVFRTSANSIEVYNPTPRRIAGLAVETASPSSYVTDGEAAYIHIVDKHRFMLPVLEAGDRRTITQGSKDDMPLITQPNSKLLEITSARYIATDGTISVEGIAIRRSAVVVRNLTANQTYQVNVVDHRGPVHVRVTSDACGVLTIPINAPYASRIPVAMSIPIY